MNDSYPPCDTHYCLRNRNSSFFKVLAALRDHPDKLHCAAICVGRSWTTGAPSQPLYHTIPCHGPRLQQNYTVNSCTFFYPNKNFLSNKRLVAPTTRPASSCIRCCSVSTFGGYLVYDASLQVFEVVDSRTSTTTPYRLRVACPVSSRCTKQAHTRATHLSTHGSVAQNTVVDSSRSCAYKSGRWAKRCGVGAL